MTAGADEVACGSDKILLEHKSSCGRRRRQENQGEAKLLARGAEPIMESPLSTPSESSITPDEEVTDRTSQTTNRGPCNNNFAHNLDVQYTVDADVNQLTTKP